MGIIEFGAAIGRVMETSGIGNSADREIGFREILFRRWDGFRDIKNEQFFSDSFHRGPTIPGIFPPILRVAEGWLTRLEKSCTVFRYF